MGEALPISNYLLRETHHNEDDGGYVVSLHRLYTNTGGGRITNATANYPPPMLTLGMAKSIVATGRRRFGRSPTPQVLGWQSCLSQGGR